MHPKGYEPVTKEHMQALLAMLPRLKLTDFIFLDFGSGKGRALFVAAEHPFRQIIGVEYSREFHETAMRNVHTYRNPAQNVSISLRFGQMLQPSACRNFRQSVL